MTEGRLRFVLVAASSLPVLAGCVTYRKYEDTVTQLDQAKRANEDLVRKLHQEMMKKRSDGAQPAAVVTAGVSEEEYARLARERDALLAQVKDLNLKFSRDDFEKLQETAEGGVEMGADGSLILASDLLFPSGVATLRKPQFAALDSIANLLKTRYSDETIIIEGHTDTDALVKTKALFKDNWDLGYQRAQSVFHYFRQRHDIREQQFVVVTYGYTKPIDASDTDEAKKKNRRVVIRRGGSSRGSLVKG